MSMNALWVSTGLMVGWCVLAQVARKVAQRMIKEEGIIPTLVNEAIAAAELCACCFELIISELMNLMVCVYLYVVFTHIVADNFGVAAYAVFLFILTVWWGQVWGDASACPYTHMEDLLEGKTTLREVALKSWAALMGGCCVYRFVQVIWWFEFAETHQGRAFEDCSADLQVNYLQNIWRFIIN